MKQNKFFILAAALAFVACSSDDNYTAKEKAQQAPQEVSFSAYLNRGVTRAGAPGVLATETGTGVDVALTAGFGVFAYYSDNQPYGQTSTPNFMYNQLVTGTGTGTIAWSYTPLKYWPNEFGKDAESDGEDKLTFFAYAPYVKVDQATGIVSDNTKTGIVALTRNTAFGDPYVKYYVDFDPDQSVDLCWGVAAADFSETVSGPTPGNSISKGKPYVDVFKPKTGSKIKFDFKHALAALNVTIDADVDVASHADGELDKLTKIWVRSVSFNGFTDKGMLNLYGEAVDENYTPNWFDLSGNTKIGSGSVTIYDGRRDGKEGVVGQEASTEKSLGLNTLLIQNEPYDAAQLTAGTPSLQLDHSATNGVQHTPKNLFNSAKVDQPIFVIPTDEELEVTIVYDVETYDPSLATYLSDRNTKGSTIENKITKTIKISDEAFKLQAGKKYTIALHLGMTSVKFDASVTPWNTTSTSGSADLPHNNAASGGSGGGSGSREYRPF